MTDAYPTLEDLDSDLAQIAGLVPTERRPAGMPPGPQDAARWLRSHIFEPPQRDEAPKQITCRDGSTIWRWGYRDRCVVLARAFFALDAAAQSYILAAREDGIPWRGDDLPVFQRIVEEAMRMQEIGADAYRKEALARMRTMRVGG